MPKATNRRKRIRTARHEADPTALPSATGSNGNQQNSPLPTSSKTKKKALSAGQERDKHLGPVLVKLSSDSADDRLWAVAATSHILASADAGTRRALQSKNIVGLLIERLSDPQTEVQAEACGALRNLAIEAGHEVCAEMFNKGIVAKLQHELATVSTALNNFLGGVRPSGDDEVRVRKVLWIWIEHLVTVFWCLAETSDKAFKNIVTIQPLSDFLYLLLKQAVPVEGSGVAQSKIPSAVALAAAQAVYVLTDVNVPSAPKFPLPRDVSKSAAYANTSSMLLESLRNLSSALESDRSQSAEAIEQALSLFVMFVGIYQNLSHHKAFGKSAKQDPSEDEHEFTVLAIRVLAFVLKSSNLHQAAEDATQAQKALSAAAALSTAPPALSSEASEASPEKRRLSNLEDNWTRIRLALEILGELVAGVDGILDSAFLGEEAFEEWNGISEEGSVQSKPVNGAQESDMMDDEETDEGGRSLQQQYPKAISTDVGRILQDLPLVLLELAQPSAVSFATAEGSNSQAVPVANLISTQTGPIDTKQAHSSTPAQSGAGTYVPAISELLSSVHARALECLNNLLITLGRATQGRIPGGAAKDDGREEEVLIETFEDAGRDDEMDEDASETVTEGSDLVNGGEHEGSGQAVPGYVTDNLQGLQLSWEKLFTTLVDFTAGWRAAFKHAVTSDSEYVELAIEACVGSIWALARLGGNQLTIGQHEHTVLLRMLSMSTADHWQSDIAVRCVGAIGQLASRVSVSDQENEVIGTALLSLLDDSRMSKYTGADVGPIDVYAQVLDTVFDIYGEEERAYDVNFRKLGFMARLQSILPTFRRLTKSVDKRKYPDTRAAADAAAVNLAEFINYRKSVAKKQQN